MSIRSSGLYHCRTYIYHSEAFSSSLSHLPQRNSRQGKCLTEQAGCAFKSPQPPFSQFRLLGPQNICLVSLSQNSDIFQGLIIDPQLPTWPRIDKCIPGGKKSHRNSPSTHHFLWGSPSLLFYLQAPTPHPELLFLRHLRVCGKGSVRYQKCLMINSCIKKSKT